LTASSAPDEVVQRRERLRRVVGAVSALPPKQRHVIVRHALDGESHVRQPPLRAGGDLRRSIAAGGHCR
jgi:hypothetical protein